MVRVMFAARTESPSAAGAFLITYSEMNEAQAWAWSVAFLLGNAFFVAAEYSLIGARRSRIEAAARKGYGSAKVVLDSLGKLALYVAGIQVAISMFGIGMGKVTEPLIEKYIGDAIGQWVGPASGVLSLFFVTFALVVIGELVPKYLTLQFSEQVALVQAKPLRFLVRLLAPFVWLVQTSGRFILKLMGVTLAKEQDESLSRDELLLALRAAQSEGVLDQTHARMVAKAMRLDTLKVQDIMIHRMDIQWLDVSTPREELPYRLAEIRHTRIPVCRGDIDDVAGLVLLNDVVSHWDQPDFSLEELARPMEVVPETITLDQATRLMRERKTQMLLISDEYGGTAGLITLEDVVEEVFGEFEDLLESERARIEKVGPYRISFRSDVRYDEVLEFLQLDPEPGPYETETMAEILGERLENVPKLGDVVELDIGTLRVENMAQRRVTRMSLTVKRSRDASEILPPASGN